MICPACGEDTVYTENTYAVGKTGDRQHSKTQRRVCKSCGAVLTVLVTERVLHINPRVGQGAASIAKRLAEERALRTVVTDKSGTRVEG